MYSGVLIRFFTYLFKSWLNIISSIIAIFIDDVICWVYYAATGIFCILPGGPRAE